jgi:hypothetical protein
VSEPTPLDPGPFRLEEATIDGLHAAIKTGAITCVQVVRHYIERARAWNGVASMLVTEDGAPVERVTGAVRAGAPLVFPTETARAAALLPDLDRYKGAPLEYGRMEATASDPSVHQQYGMIVGIPNAGQVNALATLNIRGERSVTCRGDFDRHPSAGPLPPGAPPVCEVFRHYPDALERAAELDATYGRHPDLEAMPMYGVVFSFKDPFDTKDMRTTAGGDAGYDIDFPARDHRLVEQLRAKGAIIYAKAVSTEYNGRAGDPAGDTGRTPSCRPPSGISGAAGPAIRRTPTTPRARPRSARARARPYPSAPTSSWRASARRRAPRRAGPRTTTRWR